MYDAMKQTVVMVITVSVVVTSFLSTSGLETETKGSEVVESVIRDIRELHWFPDGGCFLRRLARVLSQDGVHNQTYRVLFDGGIWQISFCMFVDTQNETEKLGKYYNNIRNNLHIHWNDVTWNQLNTPLYSGLAAALYIIFQNGRSLHHSCFKSFYKQHFIKSSLTNQSIDSFEIDCVKPFKFFSNADDCDYTTNTTTATTTATSTTSITTNICDVIDNVVAWLRNVCIIPEERMFLRRLAFVQTSACKNTNIDINGGLWKVNKSVFEATQNANFSYDVIFNSTGVDWKSVKFEDLKNPLYSGIAAALYSRLSGHIRWNKENQSKIYAEFVKKKDEYNFTDVTKLLQDGCDSGKTKEVLFVTYGLCETAIADDCNRVKGFLSNIARSLIQRKTDTQFSLISSLGINMTLTSDDRKINETISKLTIPPGKKDHNKRSASEIIQEIDKIFTIVDGSKQDPLKVVIFLLNGTAGEIEEFRKASACVMTRNMTSYVVLTGEATRAVDSFRNSLGCSNVFTAQTPDLVHMEEEIRTSICTYSHLNDRQYTCL